MKPTALSSDAPFSSHALRRLILPLVAEQILAVTVGMVDTVMVAGLGEDAVSGVSLVGSINILLTQIFAALATGGAVAVSQYLGQRDEKNASSCAVQLTYIMVLVSAVIGALTFVFNRDLLAFIYGDVDKAVMENAYVYMSLSALTYPFIALYNAGAALFRSMGNSRVSMLVSIVVNIMNVGGNALFIYCYSMGVFGAGLATLISQITAAVIITALLLHKRCPVNLRRIFREPVRPHMLGSILRVGIPNGLENSNFHIGKLLVSRLIVTFGTASIAANAIIGNICTIANIPGNAISLAIITVIGQCVGAGNYKIARIYVRRLMLLTYVCMGALATVLFILAPQVVSLFNVSPEAAQLSVECLRYVFVLTATVWPLSFVLPSALRAAGDIKLTMIVSVVSMWLVRVAASYLLAQTFGLGLLGTWMAMTFDWGVRALFYSIRIKGRAWENKRVI